MNKTLAFNILYGVYFVSTLLCAFTVFSKKRGLRNIGRYALGAAFLWHTMVIAQRWWMAGRPPMSNMFETLVFFGWCVVLVYLIFDLRYGLRALAAPTGLAALLSLGFATLIFPDTIEPLVPALQNSFWLTTHVSFCFIGYAAFAIAYVLCLLFLMKRRDWHRWAACYVASLSLTAMLAGVVGVHLQRSGTVTMGLNAVTAAVFIVACVAAAAVFTPLLSFLVRLLRLDGELVEGGLIDTVMHQTIVLGFLFLSVGIITGSVWAHQAWGRLWGWDPKETWSFITWIVYGIYLHLRFGWRTKGPLTVWFAIFGFWAVIFTYFGVNFLLAGLHSYGS